MQLYFSSFLLLIMSTVMLTNLQSQDSSSILEADKLKVETLYITDKVNIHDHSKKQDGYWMYTPDVTKEETRSVVVFIHGYGGYNPLIYGAWIKHLVRQGHIVIYPRYQKTLYIPKTEKFVKNAVIGVRNALQELEKLAYPKELWKQLDYVVHSYGGVISSNMVSNEKAYEIPPARNMLLCAPGSGPFKGGRLASYEKLPSDLNLIILVNKYDTTVGSAFAKLVFETSPQVKHKVYLKQSPFQSDTLKISAGHNECYCLDEDFDCGIRNYTSKKALRISETNSLDIDGYWKIFDELKSKGSDFEIFQKYFKVWPLGEGIDESLEVMHAPEAKFKNTAVKQ